MAPLVAIALLVGVTAQAPAEPLVLDMDGAVRMALEQNRSVKRAAQAVEEARAALQQALAAQRFIVSTSANISRQGPSSKLQFPLGEGRSVSITTLPAMSWNFGVTALQPLYHGGRLYYQEVLASLGVDTARIGVERERQDMGHAARSVFLAVVQAQQLERVAAENVSRAARHLQDARARVDADTAPGFDVIRAEAEVANASDGLVAVRAAVDKSLAALKTLLSLDVMRELQLQAPEPGDDLQVEPSDAIAKGLRQRPEVAAADKTILLADAQIGLARATDKPSVDMFANFQKVSNQGFGGHDWTWTLGLQASHLLFDHGLTRAAVDEAAARKAQAEETAKQVREGVALEVYQAWVSLGEARERIAAAEKGVAQAEEAMRIADLRYREGVGAPVEVTDARAALIAARANLVNARFAYEQARVDLEYATGTPVSARPSGDVSQDADANLDEKEQAAAVPGVPAVPGDAQDRSATPSAGARAEPAANPEPGDQQAQEREEARNAMLPPAPGRYQSLTNP